MTRIDRVAVIGAGSWGTAIARLLARQGHDTTLWALEPEVVESISARRENEWYLSGITLPRELQVTDDLDAALAGADLVVSAVPTQHVREVFSGLDGSWRADATVVSVSKGIEVDTLRTPTEVLSEVLPVGVRAGVVALSGPSFAREVAVDLPTAVVAASRSIDNARVVRDVFSTGVFRVYSSDDIVSVELAGALKNVVALAAGMSFGLGFAQNSMAGLITRGLAEIARVGVARGGNPLTFAGLSGMGDLVLTCTGELSRNRTVGFEVGRGRALDDVLAEMRMVAEGVKTTVAARRLAAELGVEVPVAEQVYLTLYEGKDPNEAVAELMGRALRDERDA
ncbi:MAG: NAD(P)H-dependent glycerol-3-phosphate dehydrogenase [Ilumatobacteraceae bacterium]